jgi:hypothetical protein
MKPIQPGLVTIARLSRGSARHGDEAEEIEENDAEMQKQDEGGEEGVVSLHQLRLWDDEGAASGWLVHVVHQGPSS